MKQTVKRFLGDTFSAKLLTVVLFFFLIFPTLKPIMDGFVKIVLLWGGMQLLYDLFTKRSFLKARNVVWLLLFLLMEVVTVALNYRIGIKDNVSLMCYTAVAMLVLYPNDQEKNPKQLIREMWIIGWVYVVLCALASVISLLTFSFHYFNVLEYGNTTYYTGVLAGRLWGIYSNPNFPAAMIAAAISLMQFPICRVVTQRKRALTLQYIGLTVCLLLNFWYVILAQSRGSLISFLAFLFVFLFFLLRKKVYYALRRFWASVLLSAAVSAAVVVLVGLSTPLVIQISADMLTIFEDKQGEHLSPEKIYDESDILDGMHAELELGREPEPEQLTGRSYLWEQGLEKFLGRPLFGYGNVGSTKGVYLHDVQIKHYHNAVVQSLVANGLAGTLPLAVFAMFSLAAMTRYVIKHRKDSWDNTGIICSCFAFIALYIANNTIEAFVVYSVSIPNFLFWIYLGYMMSLLMQGQPLSKVDGILHRLGDSDTVRAKEMTT